MENIIRGLKLFLKMSCLSSLKNRPGTQKDTDRNETMQNYQNVKVTKPNIF